MERLFSPEEVKQILGLSYRQIRYALERGLIQPTLPKDWKYNRFDWEMIVLLKVLLMLKAMLGSWQKVTHWADGIRFALHQHTGELTTHSVVSSGPQTFVVREGLFTAEERPPVGWIILETRKFRERAARRCENVALKRRHHQ